MGKLKNSTTDNTNSASEKKEGYAFLVKPIFFIGSLLFATWLVLYIEKIKPSDLGKYESIFKSNEQGPGQDSLQKGPLRPLSSDRDRFKKERYASLKKICMDYKAGVIDSTELDQQIETFLKSMD